MEAATVHQLLQFNFQLACKWWVVHVHGTRIYDRFFNWGGRQLIISAAECVHSLSNVGAYNVY